MDEKQFNLLLNRLDTIARLLALNLPKELTLTQKIEILSEMGLQPKDIGPILGTTPNSVSVLLNKIKKNKNKKSQENEENVKSS